MAAVLPSDLIGGPIRTLIVPGHLTKSKREDGSVSEYVPATKSAKIVEKSEGKEKKTDAAEVKL